MKKRIMNALEAIGKDKKKMRTFKIMSMAFVITAVVMSYSSFSNAANAFDGVVKPITDLLNSIVNPLLALVSAGGTIFCIFLGVKYATAEEPQEKEKRKQSLKTAIIGFILIFVLIVALKLSIDPLKDWMAKSTKEKTTTTEGTSSFINMFMYM